MDRQKELPQEAEELEFTSVLRVNSEQLQKLLAFMTFLCEKIEWHKKSRVVVEYNPAETMTSFKIYK